MKELEELTREIREKLPRLKNSIKAERLQESKNNCWRVFMGGIFMGTFFEFSVNTGLGNDYINAKMKVKRAEKLILKTKK